MRERNQHVETEEDPLSMSLNLEHVDMKINYTDQKHNLFLDNEDALAIRSITYENFGMYPLSPDWSRPETWQDVLSSRSETATETNKKIHEYFAGKYGAGSDLAISTGIVSEITPEITKIASKQIAGYKGPRSWRGSDRESSAELSFKVGKILSNISYKKFFLKNPTFKEGLILIKDTLIPESDPDKIQKLHSIYMEKCIKDNVNGKIVLAIPLESDYTHPVKKEEDKTMVCEATVSILLPLKDKDRSNFDKLTRNSRDFLLKRKYAKKAEKLNMLVGESITGAGFETLSAVSGEAFYLKSGKNVEYGFYLAINNFAKKEAFWRSCGKVMDFDEYQQDADLTPYFTALYVPHENAHVIFPQYDMFGEVPADVPAVIFSISECTKDLELDPRQMIRAIFTEYASEIVESSTGGELFAGYKADKLNRFLKDYLISSVVIVNAMADSKLLTVSGQNIRINYNPETVRKFIYDLEAIDRLFHKNDPNIKAKIRLAVLSPSAKSLVDLFKNQ